jgi:hypothetical protein
MKRSAPMKENMKNIYKAITNLFIIFKCIKYQIKLLDMYNINKHINKHSNMFLIQRVYAFVEL